MPTEQEQAYDWTKNAGMGSVGRSRINPDGINCQRNLFHDLAGFLAVLVGSLFLAVPIFWAFMKWFELFFGTHR